MKRTLVLLLLLFPALLSAQLPPANHPINLGYYFVDKPVWGDYNDSVNCYTDTYYVLVKEGSQCDSADTAPLWLPKMRQQLADANARNKNLHVNLHLRDAELASIVGQSVQFSSVFQQALDALTPYWYRITRIELEDEPEWGANQTDAIARAFNGELDIRGLPHKPLGIVLHRSGLFRPDGPGFVNPLNATELQWIGVEAYMCTPDVNCAGSDTQGSADPATNTANLNAFLTDAKDRIRNAGKDIVLVMQAYTRNGTWDNYVPLVVEMQRTTYLQAYNDPRVGAILMFAYARPTGTKDHPELKVPHMEIARALYGILPPGCGSAHGIPSQCGAVGPIAPPSNLRADAQQFRVTLNWNDNSSNEAEFRVQRMDNNSGVWSVIASVGANTTSYVDNTAGASTYSYRVRARNGTVASDFSNVVMVALFSEVPAVPSLIAPLNCISTLRPVFSWNATARASNYYIAVTRADIENFFVNQPGLLATTYNLTSDLIPGVQYRWKVKACNNMGCGAWAASVFFKTFCSGVGSTITAPLGCITTQTPTFVWNPVPGAYDYWLLVSNSPDFSAPTTTWYVNVHTPATSHYPGIVFSPNTTYYAKVKTLVAPNSTAGGWSATISFRPLCIDSAP